MKHAEFSKQQRNNQSDVLSSLPGVSFIKQRHTKYQIPVWNLYKAVYDMASDDFLLPEMALQWKPYLHENLLLVP